jgi:hypothetical protein
MTNLPISPVVEMKIPNQPVVTESFEGSAPWAFTTSDGGDGAWATATDQEYYGTQSLKSPTLSNGQFSDFNIVVPDGATKFRLWYRTDMNAADRLEVITLEGSIFHTSSVGGFNDWTQLEGQISAGQTLILRYERNTGGGGNACWVDNVEFLADSWVEITEDVRLESAHSGGGIRIKRGKANESPIAEPTECDMVINNRSGKYSEENPASPYYGRIGRNQPVRVAYSRVTDDFDRTVSNSWGSTPDWVDANDDTRSGWPWAIHGTAANFDVAAGEATIQAASGFQSATFGVYASADVLVRMKVSNRTSEFGIVLRQNSPSATYYYTAHIKPDTTDTLRIFRVTPSAATVDSASLPENIEVDTWYWVRAQISGRRLRARLWQDGTAEPATWLVTKTDTEGPANGVPEPTGSVGVCCFGGDALVTFANFEVNVWRAHTEVVSLPVKFDLSRTDRWVRLHTRGVLQRLGQGRKALDSALSYHLRRYLPASAMWYQLERDAASNAVAGGRAGVASGVTMEAPEITGAKALPGVAGVAHLSEDSSSWRGTAPDTADIDEWSVLFFYQLDSNPGSDVLLFTVNSTGTGRTFKVFLEADGDSRVDVYAADGVTLLDSFTQTLYGTVEIPVGSWVANMLYVWSAGGTVNWSLNQIRPGGVEIFFEMGGAYTGSAGMFRQIQAHSSSVHTAAGGLRFTQVMQYAGMFDFASPEFARAAAAYVGETNTERFGRLCDDVGVAWSIIGSSADGHPMGVQLPSKFLDLLEECAEVGSFNLEEDRNSMELVLHSRQSIYNSPTLPLDVDQGHLSEPLDPAPDDQQTRNDVTVSRPNGGSARSVQTSGPLNVNPPEEDPDGVGIYDEAPEVNYGSDDELQGAADFRRSRGTIKVPRYPSLTLDLASAAYNEDPSMTARALDIDSGTLLEVVNPEAHPGSLPQIVQGYEETIDQFDYDLVAVTTPAQVYQVGVSGYTTRVQPSSIVSAAPFLVGTDTQLICRRSDPDEDLWVPTSDDAAVADFDVMVAGVRLHVTSITGSSDPQTINVDATPTNNVETGFTIPVGHPITLAEPWRVGW